MREVIFLSNAKLAGKMCGRAAILFLALWFIAQVTDLLGDYEYPAYFLGGTLLFFLLSSVFDAAKYKVTVKKIMYSIGKVTFLFWLFIEIGCHFDWAGFDTELTLGSWSWTWCEYSTYFIVAFFASLLVGYAAEKHKRGLRTVLYGIGFVGILFWIFAALFDLFPEYQSLVLVGSIIVVAAGYVAGVFEEERKFQWVHDVDVEDFEEVAEPKVKEEAQVLESDLEITKGKNKLTIDGGSIFVPIANGKEMGGVFFGQGSYVLDIGLKKYINVFQGITSLTGSKWKKIRDDMRLRTSEEKDLDEIGLKKEEIFDLARVQIKEREWKKIGKRLKETITEVDMPFIKVRETEGGGYVKVGPIEVVGSGDEGKERVKIGPFTFREGMDIEWGGRALYDVAAKIRTKGKGISLKMKGTKTILKEDGRTVILEPNKVIVEDEDLNLKIKDKKRTLKSKNLSIYERDNRTVLKTPDTKIVLNDTVTITKNGEKKVITDPKVRDEIKEKLDLFLRDALDKKEMKELDTLLETLGKES
jgi:hypothetical protein